MLLLAFVRANWRALVAVLAVVFAVLVVSQSISYFTAWNARRHLRQQHAEASAAHAQRTAAAAARTMAYRLDSTRRATERAQLLHNLSISTEYDKKIDRARPARVPLPAFEDLPRE